MQSKHKLNTPQIAYIIYQIIVGVRYFHSIGGIHRDIKPANILIDKYCNIKICDLGLGRGDIDSGKMTQAVVTRWYRAPEILISEGNYGKEIDIWAIGCIAIEMFSRIPIFQGENNIDQLNKIILILGKPTEEDISDFKNIKGFYEYYNKIPSLKKQDFKKIVPNIDPEALDLIEKLLKFNAKKRLTLDQCLSHPFFKDVRDPESEIIETNKKINWDFESQNITNNKIRKLIYNEILSIYNN